MNVSAVRSVMRTTTGSMSLRVVVRAMTTGFSKVFSSVTVVRPRLPEVTPNSATTSNGRETSTWAVAEENPPFPSEIL